MNQIIWEFKGPERIHIKIDATNELYEQVEPGKQFEFDGNKYVCWSKERNRDLDGEWSNTIKATGRNK